MQRSIYKVVTVTTRQKWDTNVAKTSPVATHLLVAATLQGSQQETMARRAMVAIVVAALPAVIAEMVAQAAVPMAEAVAVVDLVVEAVAAAVNTP